MGNTACPDGAPCLDLMQFDHSTQREWFNEYKEVAPGFSYDVVADNDKTTRITRQNKRGVTKVVYEHHHTGIWSQWVNQVRDDNYFSTERERLAADKFSAFMISHKIDTNG